MNSIWKCRNCGWVHAEIEEADARISVMQAAAMAFARGENHRHTMSGYLTCRRKGCGTPSSEFVPAQTGDAPMLANLPPIVIPKKGATS